ncbi:hypothetical protein BJ912DRAFT_944787 [Pholiota molesta]|nr:hypothetical protein BJ912DRAFT_944787 [Pholiota molesta]
MPTTRRQTAIAEGKIKPAEKTATAEDQKTEDEDAGAEHQDIKDEGNEEPASGEKRKHPTKHEEKQEEPPIKMHKAEITDESIPKDYKSGPKGMYKIGTIERGHIYFFYRPRVQREEVTSIEDIRNFHMLMIPRPPQYLADASAQEKAGDVKPEESENMKVLEPGADAVPAPEPTDSQKKFYRLVTVGKKKLPDPESAGKEGSKRKEMFWATVTAVGEDLKSLVDELGPKMYDTKTRGTRHEGAARLVARGAYAIVNSDAKMPSERTTHFGYHISHPSELGEVQQELGIYPAASFILQVRNPRAPPQAPIQQHAKPLNIRKGEGAIKGRESFGLRFSSCETPELLNYKYAQVLMIAAHEGEEGLEKDLGEGRGVALSETEVKEGHESIKKVFAELGLDLDKFPTEPLEGSWT